MNTPLDTLTDELVALQKRRRRLAREVAALDVATSQHQQVINELVALARRQQAAKAQPVAPAPAAKAKKATKS